MNRSMRLKELLPTISGIDENLRISGLVQDSRDVQPGYAFVALSGVEDHGLRFADAARAAGASVILCDPKAAEQQALGDDVIVVPQLRARLGQMAAAFHAHASCSMSMIGITGTSGKTSTAQLCAEALAESGWRSATIGTLGAGLYGLEEPTGFTTPLVLQTHALLGQLRDEGADVVSMEVSSHALDQGRVDGVQFDVAVFTNLSRDHLDYHADMHEYAQTKAKLFAWPSLKAAVINLDDAFGREIFANLPAQVRAIGVSSRGQDGASIRASGISTRAAGLTATLHLCRDYPLQSPLLGRFNIDNLLLVAGVLQALDVEEEQIVHALAHLRPIAGRMNRLGGDGTQPLVVVDYSHKPDPLEQALQSLRAHTSGKLICVFGCGGERDRGKRPLMAEIAENNADVVIVTDDNPRGEDGDAIVAEIMAGFRAPAAVHIQRDRAHAIAHAIAIAGAEDAVLIAGKGHETYQEVAGIKHAFDDRAVAAQALRQRFGQNGKAGAE